MDKLVKTIRVYNRMLTICENLGKGKPLGMPCIKMNMDGCTQWMKRVGLYTSGVARRETIYMEYIYGNNCVQCKMSETTQLDI